MQGHRHPVVFVMSIPFRTSSPYLEKVDKAALTNLRSAEEKSTSRPSSPASCKEHRPVCYIFSIWYTTARYKYARLVISVCPLGTAHPREPLCGQRLHHKQFQKRRTRSSAVWRRICCLRQTRVDQVARGPRVIRVQGAIQQWKQVQFPQCVSASSQLQK